MIQFNMQEINNIKIKFFLLLVLCFNTLLYAQDKVHNVLILKDWKPYYAFDKNGKPTGYAIELFEVLANDIGLKYQYKIYDNWADMASFRKSGESYIIPNTGLVEMRADYTLYSDFTDTFQIKYFKRKDSYKIQNEEDLKDKKVAVVKNNICVKLMDNISSQSVVYSDRFRALSDLVSGEVDAVCYPKSLFNLTLKSFDLDEKIVDFSEPLKEVKRGIGFSINNEYLISQFNTSLKKLKNNGTYTEIYHKWFNQKNELTFTYEQIVLIFVSSLVVILILIFTIYYITRKNKWLLTKNELENTIKHKTEELELSLNLYNKALSATEEGIWDWEVKTNKVFYSPTWKTMLGYDVNEIDNEFLEWEKLIHPEDLEKSKNQALKLANGEIESYSIELRMRCKNGTYKWILSRATSVEIDINNNVQRIIGIHIDLTDQKEKEFIIQEEKEKFESIYKNSNDGIAIFDLETRFLEFNDAYLEMLGYSKEELLQRSCIDLTPIEYREKSIDALSKILVDGYIENFEKRCITKNGNQVVVNMTANLLPDKKSIIAVSKNVSSLKLIEEQERLIAMGELIGNISHQWRQPLSTISMSANIIKVDNELDDLNSERISESMDTINENVQYLSSTIDTFRNYLKENKEFTQINIKESLEESFSLTDASRRNHYITLVQNIDEDLKIYGNKNELIQVFINILNNSKDILSENEEIKDKAIFVTVKKTQKSIVVEFLDNAGGIKENIISKVFDPYFTTKHKSQGTGLGLSISEKIIREHHNGILKVENRTFNYNEQNYTGACFIITFEVT